MYGVYHGPDGVIKIAKHVHNGTLLLAKGLQDSGNTVENGLFFDTIKVQPRLDIAEIKHRATEMKINLRYFDDDSVSAILRRYGSNSLPLKCCFTKTRLTVVYIVYVYLGWNFTR